MNGFSQKKKKRDAQTKINMNGNGLFVFSPLPALSLSLPQKYPNLLKEDLVRLFLLLVIFRLLI